MKESGIEVSLHKLFQSGKEADVGNFLETNTMQSTNWTEFICIQVIVDNELVRSKSIFYRTVLFLKY